MGIIEYENEADYLTDKAAIETSKPAQKVTYINGITDTVKPNTNRPYTLYDDELLLIDADDHIVSILGLEEAAE
jgi:hypothetical protein